MGLIRSGGKNNGWVPFYNGLQIQTSSNSVPIGIVYGRNKIAPNVIWTGGFFAIAQYQKQGGKGGSKSLSGYNYYTSFEMGMCEGPIYGIGYVWSGSGVTDFTWSGLNFAAFGETQQAPWGYLAAVAPSVALSYNGLAYAAAIAFPLGSTPRLPAFSFEIKGRLYPEAVLNGSDADPALIIQDFLTNAQYGVLFPAASIDATTLLGTSGDSSYQTYCRASYLAMSPVLSNQESANSILTRWLKLTNTAAVWSGGKLKFIPYGDTPITGTLASGASVIFNPNVTPVYDLNDDDFIQEEGKDPIEIVRSDPYATFNWQRIQIADRGNQYNAVPIDVFDQNAIELYGLRMAADITANEICDKKVGQSAAQLILQRELYIRNTYKFKLSFEYSLLEPMDLVTITDAGLGLNNAAIRITEIEEDNSGILAVTAEEFPAGVAHSVEYPTQGGGGNLVNQNVVPPRVNPPVIYEPPAALTGGLPAPGGFGSGQPTNGGSGGVSQIWIALSGGIATAYKLAETSASGDHLTQQSMVASQDIGTALTLSIYVRAVERSAIRLELFNGSVNIGCNFNLVPGDAGTPDAGITSASINNAGDGWYQCQITGDMVASANPIFVVRLQNPFGTSSYAGAAGNGVYIWGAALAADGEAATFLPAFSTTAGATLATNGVTTPAGVAGVADPNWGGAFIWLSTDNVTYGEIGEVHAPARHGVLTANLAMPPGANPDITNTLSVDLTESGGQLDNATPEAAKSGTTLCLVRNELISYGTAVLTGTKAYDLTYLYRGLYGTAPASHSTGESFVRLDGAIFRYTLSSQFVGVTLYLKFQSFNIFGQSIEDLSECTVYTYTPNGAGKPLGSVGSALAVGQSLDFGAVSATVSETDQWGVVTDGFMLARIDLGSVS